MNMFIMLGLGLIGLGFLDEQNKKQKTATEKPKEEVKPVIINPVENVRSQPKGKIQNEKNIQKEVVSEEGET